jgi:Flp pilus assembly protein TadD
VIVRALLVAAAVAGFVLLAGDLRVARDVEHAVALAERGDSRAPALLQRAAERTADTTPLLREAQLQLFAERPQDALAPARTAARREPENAQAWLLLAQAAERTGDAALAERARARVSALVARP